jgi:hypothetical protein
MRPCLTPLPRPLSLRVRSSTRIGVSSACRRSLARMASSMRSITGCSTFMARPHQSTRVVSGTSAPMRARISFRRYKGRWSSNFETSTRDTERAWPNAATSMSTPPSGTSRAPSRPDGTPRWSGSPRSNRSFEQARAGEAARNGAARRRLLDHLLAPPAGLLHPGDLDDLQLGGDHVEQRADVFSHDPELATAVVAALAGVEGAALARSGVGHAGLAARRLGRRGLFGARRLDGIGLVVRRDRGLGRGDLQILERQLQLFDLALDLLRGLAEGLLLQPRDPHPERLDQQIMGAQRDRHLRVLRLKRRDHRLQGDGVIGQRSGFRRHAHGYHTRPMNAIKTR